MKTGESFGELALLNETKRSATLIATEDSTLVVLDRETFLRFMKDLRSNRIDEINSIIDHCALVSELSERTKKEIAMKTIMVKFEPNTLLARQGEPVSSIFFIKRGNIKVIKRIMPHGEFINVEVLGMAISEPNSSWDFIVLFV